MNGPCIFCEVKTMKRIFLIVLDSFGIGGMPDSEAFGDVNVNTLAACWICCIGKLRLKM